MKRNRRKQRGIHKKRLVAIEQVGGKRDRPLNLALNGCGLRKEPAQQPLFKRHEARRVRRRQFPCAVVKRLDHGIDASRPYAKSIRSAARLNQAVQYPQPLPDHAFLLRKLRQLRPKRNLRRAFRNSVNRFRD